VSMLTPPGLKGKQYRITGTAYPRLARPNRRRRYTVFGVLGVMVLAVLGWGGVQLFGVFGGGKADALACGAKAAASPSPGVSGAGDAAGPTASGSVGASGSATAGSAGASPAAALAASFAHLTPGHVPQPSTITVNVYNATDRVGLASQTAALLKKRGFVIGTIGNAPAALQHKVLGTAQVTGNSAAAASMTVVGSEVVGAKPTTDLRKTSTVDLVLGNGFSGALATPLQSTQTLALAAKPLAAPSPGHC
jgi:hypothetical protein